MNNILKATFIVFLIELVWYGINIATIDIAPKVAGFKIVSEQLALFAIIIGAVFKIAIVLFFISGKENK